MRCMWNSHNQALTSCDYKHGTEAEWVPQMDVEFWQWGTHFLGSQTWHRSRMNTMDACGILTIKHWHPVITNMAQKQNEHHGCMWNPHNQTLTYCDHKNMAQAEWAPWMYVEFWQSSTHMLWSQTWHRIRVSTMDACGILTIRHSLPVIINMEQKQNEHHGWMWNSDNQALTPCDHKHGTEAEWAP